MIRLQEDARRDSENLRRFAAELAVANRRLQQAALTDPLTGLPNRRYAMERLEQEWAATAVRNARLTCMVVDVDGFKQINDSYGHDSGDVVLRQVATVLRKEARAEDVICRLGGEEFLVICPDTPLGRGASSCGALAAGRIPRTRGERCDQSYRHGEYRGVVSANRHDAHGRTDQGGRQRAVRRQACGPRSSGGHETGAGGGARVGLEA